MPELCRQHADTTEPGTPKGDTSLSSLAPGRDDVDSTYAAGETQAGTDVTSALSSITQYREENGRIYHSYGSTEHWGPNDDKAQDQQDLSHHLFGLVLKGELFLAPVKPSKVLDLGTGTGIWAIDVAELYPEAIVYGIDVSPIQPTLVPPNCFFEVDDYNVEWVDKERYDLIHARELLGTVPDWPALYQKAYEALKPSGWIEQHEPDFYFESDAVKSEMDHPFLHWYQLMLEAGIRANARFDVGPNIKGWMEGAGFINVTEHRVLLPIGTWCRDESQKEVGTWNWLRLDQGLAEFCSRRFHNQMGVGVRMTLVDCSEPCN